MLATDFSGPRTLIRHARDEIEDADRHLRTFFQGEPYTRVIDIDHERGEQAYKIRLTAEVPEKVSVIVRDAAAGLRDALDHAVYAASCILTGLEADKTGFPFAKDAARVAGALRRLQGNPPEIRPLLASFAPHEGGNDLLWGLNCLRNPNTHRFIVPVGTVAAGHKSFLLEAGPISGPFKFGYSRWDAAKNEVEFMRTGIGVNVEHDVQIGFAATFQNIPVLNGAHVVPTLDAMAREVDMVVDDIERKVVDLKGSIGSHSGTMPR